MLTRRRVDVVHDVRKAGGDIGAELLERIVDDAVGLPVRAPVAIVGVRVGAAVVRSETPGSCAAGCECNCLKSAALTICLSAGQTSAGSAGWAASAACVALASSRLRQERALRAGSKDESGDRMTCAESPVAVSGVADRRGYGPHDYRRCCRGFSKRGTACPLRKCFRTLLACFRMLRRVGRLRARSRSKVSPIGVRSHCADERRAA